MSVRIRLWPHAVEGEQNSNTDHRIDAYRVHRRVQAGHIYDSPAGKVWAEYYFFKYLHIIKFALYISKHMFIDTMYMPIFVIVYRMK